MQTRPVAENNADTVRGNLNAETTVSEIIIQAQNPLDLQEEDLRDYIGEVRKQLPEIEVHFDEGEKMPAGARGVTWWEVIRVYLSDVPDEIKGAVIAKLLDVGYNWAKRRFEAAQQNRRPKCVVVHGENRQEEGSMVLRSADDTPVTVEEATKPEPVTRARKSGTPKKAASKRKQSSKPKKDSK